MPNLLRVASVVYLLLFVAGYIWIRLLDLHPFRWEHFRPLKFFPEIGAGVVIAGAVVGLSLLASRLSAWARTVEREFRKIFGKLSSGEILGLALLSGTVEEIFFRGAMQNALGIVFASIVFGVLHVGPRRVFLPWTLFAVGMGFLLGFFYQITGSLTGPITVHVIVNLVNLGRISWMPPPAEETEGGGESRDGEGG
jgi:membrane protease YdiL (CAAX protease family)